MSAETLAGNSRVIHSHDCPLQAEPHSPPGLILLKEKCAAYCFPVEKLIFNPENYLFSKGIRVPERGFCSEESHLPCPQYRAWVQGCFFCHREHAEKGHGGLLPEEPSS